MARTENYAARTYTEDGNVVAYITDPAHVPPQWQENLEGQRKAAALKVIENDRTAAGTSGYAEHIISAAQGLTLRTSKATGNSWEVKTPVAPSTKEIVVLKGTVTVVPRDGKVSILITGDQQ